MSKATKDEINKFLLEVKSTISKSSSNFYLIPREKNMKYIASIGLSIPNVMYEIMNLTYKNYFNGPCQDDNSSYTGFIWEFGKDEETFQIYIKLKIKQTSKGKIVQCLSFHEADRAINYCYT